MEREEKVQVCIEMKTTGMSLANVLCRNAECDSHGRTPNVKRFTARVLLLFYLGGLTACSGWWPGDAKCSEDFKFQTFSPDRRYVADVFDSNCGATSSVVRHVNLRLSTEGLSPDARGLINNGLVLAVKHRPDIKLNWETPKSLLIECAGCTDEAIYRQEKQWQDVTINYRISGMTPDGTPTANSNK